jgi:ADP-ribose pyrophosphatase
MKIYRGTIVSLDVEEVRLPNGTMMRMELVRHPGGAAVVAIDAQDRVCLLRHYRPAVGAWLWELPAGKRDHGEPALVAARRELQEEAGLMAARWDALGSIWSSPGILAERIELYLARGLTRVTASADEDEVFEIHWLAFDEALEKVLADDGADAKTIAGLARAERVRKSR